MKLFFIKENNKRFIDIFLLCHLLVLHVDFLTVNEIIFTPDLLDFPFFFLHRHHSLTSKGQFSKNDTCILLSIRNRQIQGILLGK